MKAWLRRFGLHLAAAVGATGIFVAAAAVGATGTRQQSAAVSAVVVSTRPAAVQTPSPEARQQASPLPSASAPAIPPAGAAGHAQPSAVPAALASPSAQPARTPAATPATAPVNPERSIAGTIKNVSGDGLQVISKANKDVRVTPLPGALIRLNGKTVPLDQLLPGDTVVVLGQQVRSSAPNVVRFQAHAITARRT